MARPSRCRRICEEPYYDSFHPCGVPCGEAVMTLDEYETLRLIDYEGLNHEQCAARMNISRTTVTEIYEQARHRLADCIVNGKSLRISGGNYRICSGNENGCGRCRRQKTAGTAGPVKRKEAGEMRIAVTYENGQIFQHFGHTEQFKLYDVENGEIVREQVVDTNGSGHGALAGFLKEHQADVLICGGIGGGAQAALAEAGIRLYGGVSGNADEAAKALAAGELNYDPDVHCSHHDHEHGEGHSCGEHGGHSCGEHHHGCGGHENHSCGGHNR